MHHSTYRIYCPKCYGNPLKKWFNIQILHSKPCQNLHDIVTVNICSFKYEKQQNKNKKLEISHRVLTLDLNCYNRSITSIVRLFLWHSAIQKSYTTFQLFPFSSKLKASPSPIISFRPFFLACKLTKRTIIYGANIQFVVIANFFWPFLCVQLTNLWALCHIKNAKQWD